MGLDGVQQERFTHTAVQVMEYEAEIWGHGRPRLRARALRAAPPCDIDALSRALANFSVLCHERADLLNELHVNPVIVGAEGLFAVDMLVATAPRHRE